MDEPASRPFPAFLATIFPQADLERAEASIAVIGPSGDILWVNPYWRQFAEENGGEAWRDGRGSYLDGIAPPLRDFFRTVFANVLLTGEAYEQDYECSSPEKARHYRLRILPIGTHALVLEHSLVDIRPHDTERVAGAAADYTTPGGIIVQCSNCRRVRRPGTRAWDWVPPLVANLHPKISHGICPSCVGYYWATPRTRRPSRP